MAKLLVFQNKVADMKMESGRSLIEVIGVLAIAGVMTAGIIATYNVMHKNQLRTVAQYQMQQLASDVKLLMEMGGDYSGVSVDYLVDAGALKDKNAPIGNEWFVRAEENGAAFSINLMGLANSDCQYFATLQPKWATRMIINGHESDASDACLTTGDNQISFIVK